LDTGGEHNRESLSVADAFPVLSSGRIQRCLDSISADSDVKLLLSGGELHSFSVRMSKYLSGTSTVLGELLVGLRLCSAAAIPQHRLSIQLRHAFVRRDLLRWRDVLDIAPAEISCWPECDSLGLLAFLALAVRASVMALSSAGGLEPAVETIDHDQNDTGDLQACDRQLLRVLQWAEAETEAKLVGDVIVPTGQLSFPHAVEEVMKDFLTMPLERIVKRADPPLGFGGLIQDFIDSLDARDSTVFFRRITCFGRDTLSDLAEQLAITRERVRQLEVETGALVRNRLERDRHKRIVWRAETLHRMLGTAAPVDSDHYNYVKQYICRDIEESLQEKAWTLLLWISGPYKLKSAHGWLVIGSIPGEEMIRSATGEHGLIDHKVLKEHLSRAGVASEVHELWLRDIVSVRQLGNDLFLWHGTVADKSEVILRYLDRPATPAEVIAVINEGHNVAGARSVIHNDDRFMRVDKERVALREWEMEEYEGIAVEIQQRIERSGGIAEVEHVVSTLGKEFGLRDASIRVYMKCPMFVIENDFIRLRKQTEPYPIKGSISDAPACYLASEDCLNWRITVDRQFMRGSGRKIPETVAAWLDIEPGQHDYFSHDTTNVVVSWPKTTLAPSIGSIRALIEQAGCVEGESAIVRLNRVGNEISVERVDGKLFEHATQLERLSLLTGIPLNESEDEFLLRLRSALPLESDSSSLADGFKRKGESELVRFLPGEGPANLDDAMRGLEIGLLGNHI